MPVLPVSGLFHEMIGRFIAANETMSAFELAQMVIKDRHQGGPESHSRG